MHVLAKPLAEVVLQLEKLGGRDRAGVLAPSIEGGDHHHSVMEQIAVEAVRLVCLVDQLDIGEVLMSPGARALERLDAPAAVSRCRSRFFGPMCAVMSGHCGSEAMKAEAAGGKSRPIQLS